MRIEIKDKKLNQIQFKYTNTLTKNKKTRIFKNKNANVTGSTCFFAMFIDFPCSFSFIFVFNNYQSFFLHNFDLFSDHTHFSLTTYRAKVLLNAVLDTYSGVLVFVLRSSVCSGFNFGLGIFS